MKDYNAHFTNERTSIMIAIDGISPTHASARAWIKFMRTRAFTEDEDSWVLEGLEIAK